MNSLSLSSELSAHRLLRIGVAIAFLYPSFAALSDPVSWLSYFPDAIRNLPVDPVVLLHAFGVVEIILALWILSGWKIKIPAMLMTIILVGIVVSNMPSIDVLFRDISIAFMTIALFFWPNPQTTVKTE